MGSCISVQNKRQPQSAKQQNSVDAQGHGFQTPMKPPKTLENQTTDDEGHHKHHHHHHHHHLIEEKVDYRKQTDLKTKEIEVHTSIYTSPNTKIVTNKSEGPLPPQQHSINASVSANEEDDCDAMNIPCENAAVQPLCEIQRDALDSLSIQFEVGGRRCQQQINNIHNKEEAVLMEGDIKFEFDNTKGSASQVNLNEKEDGEHHNKSIDSSQSSESSLSQQEQDRQSPINMIDQKLLERLHVRDRLYQKFNETLQQFHQDPIVTEQTQNGVRSTIRRRAQEDGVDMFILERTDMGVTPDQILKLLANADVFLKANSNLKKCEIIEHIDLGDENPVVQVYSCLFNSPAAFIDGRIFVDVKYTITDEMLCLMSSEGNDKEREEFMEKTGKNIKGMSLAFCRLTGLKLYPVFDHNQSLIGTKGVFVTQFDYGGSIPKWLIMKQSPQNILSFYEEFIKMARKLH